RPPRAAPGAPWGPAGAGGLCPGRISLATLTHSLQMYTPAPATSCTPPSPRSLPQKLHLGRCLTTLGTLPLRRKIMASSLRRRRLAVRCRDRNLLRRHDDVVDQAVGLGLLRGEEVIALGVLLDALDGLTGVPGQYPVQQLARAQDLFGVNLNVGCLALHSAPRLVNEDVGVRQSIAAAVRTARQQHSAHGVGHADADRRNR